MDCDWQEMLPAENQIAVRPVPVRVLPEEEWIEVITAGAFEKPQLQGRMFAARDKNFPV